MVERLADRLREAIEEEIATGALLPGSRLEEEELAQRFGVSRTPIREALNLLLGEGLIEIRPRRGAIVLEIGIKRLLEMFEVMAELEAMCARLAVRRMTNEDLIELERTHQACYSAVEAMDSDAYFYANEQFHFAIYAASQNDFLVEQARSLQRRLRPYRRLQLRVRDRVRKSFEEHTAILEYFQRGEADRLADAVRQHVTVQGERFGDLVQTLSRLRESSTPSVP